MKVSKAIIPVAGLGTRFLPATKAIPKELVPLVDRPVLQWVVEEAVAAGVREIIFVVSPGKPAIRDHFSTQPILERELARRGKTHALASVRRVSHLAKFRFVIQKQAHGDGDAVRQAARFIGQESCAILFGDDVMVGKPSAIGELITISEMHKAPAVALAEVPRDQVSRYGVVGGVLTHERTIYINRFLEKPKARIAPSNFVAIGRYVLTADAMNVLKQLQPAADGEIRIAGIWDKWLPTHPLIGYVPTAQWFPCGEPEGWLKANCELARLK